MFTPIYPQTERPRVRTEREYQEWQLSLRKNVPGKRVKNGSSILTRLASTVRRVIARQPRPLAEPHRMEQEASHVRG